MAGASSRLKMTSFHLLNERDPDKWSIKFRVKPWTQSCGYDAYGYLAAELFAGDVVEAEVLSRIDPTQSSLLAGL